MEPLYQRFDAFVTISSGEAPEFRAHDSRAFWRRANHFTAANVTGQPVLALPSGFGPSGLPLGMQLLGRPFGEAVILRIGHAYQRATEWHLRHPALVPHATAPPVEEPETLTEPHGEAVAALRAECTTAAGRAGLDLDARMLAQLLDGAPYALAMADRMPRDHNYAEAPANVLTLQSP